MRVLTENLM
jgi:hypothetical protein